MSQLQMTATSATQAQVSTEGNSNALRQRRYRLRKQNKASGGANLHTACRECGKAIKPSYCRTFCPGGGCRKLFYKKVQVTHVCRITRADAQLSEAILVQGIRPA